MNQLRFLSREKLIEYLDEEMRQFLNHKGIYEINQYGWLTDDRPDPDYIGLAMWQTEPPSKNSVVDPDSGMTAPPPLSQPSLDSVFKNGLEFEGLMKAARHSIGFTFLYNEPSDPSDVDKNSCFLHHYADAVMKLDLATDRLRELFSNSFESFAKPTIKNNDPTNLLCCMKDEHYLFCHPFIKTRDRLVKKPDHYQELLECFRDLIPLIEQTSFYRLDSLEHSKKLYLPDETGCFATPPPTENQAGHMILDGDIVTRDIAEWYKLLVRTGSQVFLAEYLYRNFDKEIPNC